jgi:hypothetical protein
MDEGGRQKVGNRLPNILGTLRAHSRYLSQAVGERNEES